MTVQADDVILAWNSHMDEGENPPGSNDTTFGRWYGMNPAPWCFMANSFMLVSAGYVFADDCQGGRKGFASCELGHEWAVKHGLWKPASVTPLRGWSILYDWDGDGTADHIGSTEYTDGAGVHTIEANAPDREHGESADEISHHLLGPTGDRNRCFGYIAWDLSQTSSSASPPPAQPTYKLFPGRNMSLTSPLMQGNDVRTLQGALNDPGRVGGSGYHLSTDGVFGRLTYQAVRDYQNRHGLTVDGVCGPATWGNLRIAA